MSQSWNPSQPTQPNQPNPQQQWGQPPQGMQPLPGMQQPQWNPAPNQWQPQQPMAPQEPKPGSAKKVLGIILTVLFVLSVLSILSRAAQGTLIQDGPHMTAARRSGAIFGTFVFPALIGAGAYALLNSHKKAMDAWRARQRPMGMPPQMNQFPPTGPGQQPPSGWQR